jgi:hypothetical protein
MNGNNLYKNLPGNINNRQNYPKMTNEFQSKKGNNKISIIILFRQLQYAWKL